MARVGLLHKEPRRSACHILILIRRREIIKSAAGSWRHPVTGLTERGGTVARRRPECERGNHLSELAGCAPERGITALLCKGMRAAFLRGSSSRTACLSPREFPREPCRGRGAAGSILSLSVSLIPSGAPFQRCVRRFPESGSAPFFSPFSLVLLRGNPAPEPFTPAPLRAALSPVSEACALRLLFARVL